MKKSLITLITFVLVLVNLVLTIMLTFTILPETKKANNLIGNISTAIDLDLSAGQSSGGGSTSLENTEPYTMKDTITTNLKSGDDGKQHYAIIGLTLNINKKSEGYKSKKYTKDDMNNYDGVIKSALTSVMSKYTIDEAQNHQDELLEEIKDKLGQSFGRELITSVGFSTATFQ